jgi:hypothetical protein
MFTKQGGGDMAEAIRPAPYDPDTKAKGWRFELDLEQIMQSDTWALAAPDERPWLFMLWATAWQQTPCGSMPSDPKLICARLGMSAKQFDKCKEVLLRGWWLADDGRLYHDTIATRVQDMLGRKNGERNRKAEWRAKKEAEERLRDINAETRDRQDVPPMSHGTDMGQTWDSHGTDDTGTGTGTGLSTGKLSTHSASACDLSTGEVCKAMKRAGVGGVNPGSQTLKALLDAGATLDEFTGAASKAAEGGKGFAYALGIVKRDREQAAAMAAKLHRGELPPAETTYQRSMRERMAEAAPAFARPPPGQVQTPHPSQAAEFFLDLARQKTALQLPTGAAQ